MLLPGGGLWCVDVAVLQNCGQLSVTVVGGGGGVLLDFGGVLVGGTDEELFPPHGPCDKLN